MRRRGLRDRRARWLLHPRTSRRRGLRSADRSCAVRPQWVRLTRLTPSTGARRAAALLAWFGVLVAVGLGLHALAGTAASLDHVLVRDAVAIRTGPLTTVAHGASLFGRSWLLIAFAVLVGLTLVRPLGMRAWAPLLSVVGADALQNAIKAIVNRPRPSVTHLEHVTSSSFPSGHATQCTAFLVALIALIYSGRSGRGQAAATFCAARAGVRRWRVARISRRALPDRCGRGDHPRRSVGGGRHPMVKSSDAGAPSRY